MSSINPIQARDYCKKDKIAARKGDVFQVTLNFLKKQKSHEKLYE